MGTFGCTLVVQIALLLHLFAESYSQWSNCMWLQKVQMREPPEYYFVLRGDLVLLISKDIILRDDFNKSGLQCSKFTAAEPIAFPWNEEFLAILTKLRKGKYVVNLVKVKEILEQKRVASLPLDLHPETNNVTKYFINDYNYSSIDTCHHNFLNGRLYCYTIDNADRRVVNEHEMMINDSSLVKDKENKWSFPFILDKIASYTTARGGNNMWIKHRLQFFYDTCLDEMRSTGIPRMTVYHMCSKDRLPFGVYEFTYVDAFNIVTRHCSESGSCMYIHSVPNHQVSQMSCECWMRTTSCILPGIVFNKLERTRESERGEFSPWHPVHPKEHSRGAKKDEGDSNFNNIPMQVLAFITFVYLCFFFYCALKPHRKSNLSELSVLMEAEAARLSALINEAKRSKTRLFYSIYSSQVEREKHALLMLKNRPQQVPVTGFTEQLCCMGTTCESWLCAHCRQTDDRTPSVIPHPRTSPLELDAANEVAGKLRSNSSRLRRKTQRRTIANVQDSPAGHAKYTKEAPNRRRSMSVSAKKTKECSHDKKLANERAKARDKQTNCAKPTRMQMFRDRDRL